jgi:hypothetical protein
LPVRQTVCSQPQDAGDDLLLGRVRNGRGMLTCALSSGAEGIPAGGVGRPRGACWAFGRRRSWGEVALVVIVRARTRRMRSRPGSVGLAPETSPAGSCPSSTMKMLAPLRRTRWRTTSCWHRSAPSWSRRSTTRARGSRQAQSSKGGAQPRSFGRRGGARCGVAVDVEDLVVVGVGPLADRPLRLDQVAAGGLLDAAGVRVPDDVHVPTLKPSTWAVKRSPSPQPTRRTRRARVWPDQVCCRTQDPPGRLRRAPPGDGTPREAVGDPSSPIHDRAGVRGQRG